MQIVYLGFVGSSALEAEAGVQLLRLDRFSGMLSGCHLAIEQLSASGSQPAYDVRLDLFLISHDLRPIGHCAHEDPLAAMRAAFDAAERELCSAASVNLAANGAVRRDH
jgi:hypothetical protein